MNRFKKVTLCMLALLVFIFIFPTASSAKTTSLTDTTASLTVGESTTLKIGNVKANKIKWKSSKTSVATVSNKGVVKAKKVGSATITATYSKITFKCKVTVVAKAKKVVLYNDKNFKVTFMGLSKEGVTLKIQNKTNDICNMALNYFVCDKEYYDCYTVQIIPNKSERTITYEGHYQTVKNPTAKKLSVNFNFGNEETGENFDNIIIKNIKIR